jgi:hypothetical protein
VNYISARWVCTRCATKGHHDTESNCDICKPIECKEEGTDFCERKKNWSCYNSSDPIEEFVTWLLTAFSSKIPVIIYSHNGGR